MFLREPCPTSCRGMLEEQTAMRKECSSGLTPVWDNLPEAMKWRSLCHLPCCKIGLANNRILRVCFEQPCTTRLSLLYGNLLTWPTACHLQTQVFLFPKHS